MEETLETKQQFLRTEILDQGYDANIFSQFMGTIKNEENVDLEKWTMEEIKNAVQSFKSKISELQQQQQQEQQEPNPDQQETNTNVEQTENVPQTESPPKEESKPTTTTPTTDPEKKTQNKTSSNNPFEEYEEVIKCIKLKENEITNRNDLFVTISSPERIKGGIFSSAYYQYKMKITPVNYEVVRKVDDFTFLYNKLPLIHPGVFNPVLPHFDFGLKDDSPKKMLLIQNYMNSLVENIFHRSLPMVFEFLTLPQDKWNKQREKYNNLKEVTSFSKMPTLEGKMPLKINKEEDNKALKIKDLINNKNVYYEKFNTTIDEVLTNFEKLSNSLKTLSSIFQGLSNTHKENTRLLGSFNRLYQIMNKWGSDLIKERDFIRDELKYYIKFYAKENTAFMKYYEDFRLGRDAYLSKFEKIKKIPNKTKNDLIEFSASRQYYGYLLYNLNSEYKKLGERQADRAFNKFILYNENKDILLQNYSNFINLLNFHENIDKTSNLNNKNEANGNNSENVTEEGNGLGEVNNNTG